MDGGSGIDTLDVRFFSGTYELNMITGVTNFTGETAINFENVYTGGGHDKIIGTAGANYIYTGLGNDRVNAGSGNDTVSGGDGNDSLYGEDGNDYLYGGNDNDYLHGGNDSDKIYGGNGNDWIDGGFSVDYMDGGDGIDTLDVRFWNSTYELNMNTGVTNFTGEIAINFENVYTGGGNDKIVGTEAVNYISTGSGHDRVNAGSGDDTVSGGNGNDYLYGEDGNDYLYGGNNNDRLYGGNGNDRIYGGAGNDYIDGGWGLDVMDGGSGVDTLDVRFFNGAYILDMNTGVTNFSGETAKNFERVYTGGGHDKITGTAGANYIYTGSGNDTVYGGGGNDTISGGNGNDYLSGGVSAVNQSGVDILIGGGNSDKFVLGNAFSNHYLGSGYAKITDFDKLENDKIQVKDYGSNNANNYSLGTGNWGGTSALDTGIYFQGDLIGVVQDNTSISLNSDFSYASLVITSTIKSVL